jgi:ribosome-binding factor A
MVNPRTLHRIESRIKERAAYCLQFELKDPRGCFVTITRVELDPEMKAGKIFWSCLGDHADRNKAEKMLTDAAGYIQRQVARVLEMRNMPHLTWAYDDSIEKAAALSSLISQARARDDEIRPEDEDELTPADEELESGPESEVS